MLPVESPFKVYTGLDGKPLDNGYVYFGIANQNPITSPVTVYWDSAGTQPAVQPLRTENGYIMRAGTPANVFYDGAYSELVQDSRRRQVFYARTSDDFSISSFVISFLLSLAASTGASLIGFIQAGVGAVLRTMQAKARETVSPEDFGAVGDGVTNDYAALQAAIDSFTTATGARLVMTPGKTYKINTSLTTNNRNIVIEGNNAIILIGATMTYGIQIISTNCEVRNLQINRAAGAVVTAGVYMTGLQHVLRNVTSRNQIWPTFILGQDLKESHFSEIRVDNDAASKTGTIFQFDYCVNNTISDSMLGYCNRAVYCSSVAQPTFGYFTEGLLINNVVVVYASIAASIDNGTFIAISNCCFDFCETQGVFASNGNTISVSNTWIASNVTNGFIGVGSLAGVLGMSVMGNFFVRGAAAIAGTAGVSLTGTNAVVSNNSFQSGMNGGTVTQATSQVFGNTVSGGGTNISAAATISSVVGSLLVSAGLEVGTTLEVAGNQGIFPLALAGTATAGVNGAPPAQVSAYATVDIGGVTYKVPLYNN